MTDKEFKLGLGVYLIYQLESCRNGYGLTKALAWKFDIIDSVDFTESLVKEELVSKQVINGLEHFTITMKGKEFIKILLHDNFYQEMLQRYPLQKEFIDGLFRLA